MKKVENERVPVWEVGYAAMWVKFKIYLNSFCKFKVIVSKCSQLVGHPVGRPVSMADHSTT